MALRGRCATRKKKIGKGSSCPLCQNPAAGTTQSHYDFDSLYPFSAICATMASQDTDATESSRSNVEFRFVTGPHAHELRSHAMREHWKDRRRRMGAKKQKYNDAKQSRVTIRPNTGGVHGTSSRNSGARLSSDGSPDSSQATSATGSADSGNASPGIPPATLSGVDRALSSCRLDPFDQFPVRLNAEHHKLLHHCMGPPPGSECMLTARNNRA